MLPDTRPGLVLDERGVCTACRQHAERRAAIDWNARRRAWESLVAPLRATARGYDCVVPVSGGKDSTWQVVRCLESGLRVLAVTWRTPGRTVLGQRNLDNLVQLGVDHLDYTINPEVERRLTLAALERTGSSGVPMHMAIYAIPLRIAVRFQVPLVVWGENPHEEYGRTDATAASATLDPDWGRRHGILQNTTVLDWVGEGLSEKDLEPYFPPGTEEFERSGVKSVFLGDYLAWNPQESLRAAQSHGFEARSEGPRVGLYNYADVDCEFISVHHYFKWLKFGFTRLHDNLALEIRNGRLSRAGAIEIISQRGDQTPHDDIAALCRFLRIAPEHFRRIEEKFRNRAIWRKQDGHWRIPGFLIPEWDWSGGRDAH